MITRSSTVLMIAEDDLEQLIEAWDSVPPWIKAHVIPRRPAHRYEGELIVDDAYLIFSGRDVKSDQDVELVLGLEWLTDVSLGFSDRVMDSIDPAFGIGGPVPLAITYRIDGKSQTIYIYTSFKKYLAHGDRDNLKWAGVLSEVLEKNQRSKRESMRHTVPARA